MLSQQRGLIGYSWTALTEEMILL